jgi:hypothetical protein
MSARFTEGRRPRAWLRDEVYNSARAQAIKARVHGGGFGVARHDSYDG